MRHVLAFSLFVVSAVLLVTYPGTAKPAPDTFALIGVTADGTEYVIDHALTHSDCRSYEIHPAGADMRFTYEYCALEPKA